MIIDLDTDSTYSPTPAAHAPGHRAHAHRVLNADSFLNPIRSAREASFERTHSLFWDSGFLDRLSLPLTRYHE